MDVCLDLETNIIHCFSKTCNTLASSCVWRSHCGHCAVLL